MTPVKEKQTAEELPPAEQFWKKYSPHYELPISTVATGAFHLLVVATIIIIATLLMKPVEKPPVPVRSITLTDAPSGSLNGSPGSGGGDEKAEVTDERPEEPVRNIPKADLERVMVAASQWVPELKDNQDALKAMVESPNFKKLDGLNEDLKKRIAKGFGNPNGSGDNAGKGNTGEAGTGSGGKGGPDATSSGSRSSRWIITFKTNSGPDYLRQLSAFGAKIVVEEPPDWKRNRIFDDLINTNPGRLLGAGDALPEMSFVDDNKASVKRVAETLGVNFVPPRFIAFFPKDVEVQLAAKETAFRNRKEDQIYSTTFSVVERDGKYEIKVTDQVAKRK